MQTHTSGASRPGTAALVGIGSPGRAIPGFFAVREPGTNGDPNFCEEMGACCLGTVCHFLEHAEGVGRNGIWQGAWVDCTAALCQPVPVRRETWGRLKQSYRQARPQRPSRARRTRRGARSGGGGGRPGTSAYLFPFGRDSARAATGSSGQECLG